MKNKKAEKLVKERIRKFTPYEISQIDEGEIKLDAQENPYAFSDELRNEIKGTITDFSFNRYPDPSYRELKNMISAYCGLKSANILVGNGSDELILAVLIAAAGEGKTVAAPSPTFSMYGILSTLTGSRYRETTLGKDFSLDADKLLSLNADVTFIAYPNNPTGNCFSEKEIEKILISSDGLVVVDEAYYEFSGKSFTSKINEFNNLVILRTFSKAFALAGIRAGYLLCNEDLALQLRKAQLPYNISALNEEILKVILSKRREILGTVQVLIDSRKKMAEKLSQMPGIKVYPSDANFILLKIDRTDDVIKTLEKNKIRVRRFSEKRLKNYLRVSVGAEKENRKFLKALEEIL